MSSPERRELLLGRYELLELIATGGMGEVFLARVHGPAGFSKHVVIKRILRHLAREPRFVELFLNEARLAAQLAHRNVVQVFELGESEGTWFIVMEYVPGISARGLLRRLPPPGHLSPQLAAFICTEALRGLHHAHELLGPGGLPLRLIHRDVSPDNLLISADGEVKLTDFGIAKAATGEVTATGRVGKASYMAPELLRGEPVDRTVDLYAAGVVLYQLLTGRHPFESPTEAVMIHATLTQAARPPGELVPGLDPALDAIVLRSLAKDAGARFGSAEEMALALGSFLMRSPGFDGARELSRVLRTLEVPTPGGGSLKPGSASTGRRPGAEGTPARVGAPSTARVASAPQEPTGGTLVLAREWELSATRPAASGTPSADGATLLHARGRRGGRARAAALAGALVLLGTGVAGLWMQGSKPPASASTTDATGTLPPATGKSQVPRASMQPDPVGAATIGATAAATTAAATGDGAPEGSVADARVPATPVAAAPSRLRRSVARPSETGTVLVRVFPWADVSLGTRRLGRTPMEAIELPEGRHVLLLENPELGVSRRVPIRIRGERRTTVKIDLLGPTPSP